MDKRTWLFGLGGVVGVVLILFGWHILAGSYTYQGSVIDPPVEAADFVLQDQSGQEFKLADQRGKVTLLFFGYTNCPDVCPVTLSEFRQVKAKLGDAADEVRFVFITVDPQRDTVERLNKYLSGYDPVFIGLTGSDNELEPVYQAYGVYHARQDVGSAAGYLVDHTARTYIIDKHGRLRMTYPFEMDWRAMAEDVRHLLKEE